MGKRLVEVRDPRVRAEATRGWRDRDDRPVERARRGFEQTVRRVPPRMKGGPAQLRVLAEEPERIRFGMGGQPGAQVGGCVTGASTAGDSETSMTWQRRPARDA